MRKEPASLVTLPVYHSLLEMPVDNRQTDNIHVGPHILMRADEFIRPGMGWISPAP